MKLKRIGQTALSTAVIISTFLSVPSVQADSQHKAGQQAYKHTEFLTEKIGQRVAGTANEEKARNYIFNELNKLGYQPTEQHFTYITKGVTK
jgi:alkaline phosphatase isozyme conversion protein